MVHLLWYVVIGLGAGVLAGFFGVGGGIVIIPALVMGLGMTQHSANGTSLVALLLPVGFMGVLEYYRAGKIGPENIKAGLLIAVGIFVGTFFGSRYALGLSPIVLKRSFSVFMFVVAIKLWMSTR